MVVAGNRIVQQTMQSWLSAEFAVDPKAVPDALMGDPSEYGTFKDSLRAPIHRWFKYPAGYSHRLVEAKIRQHGLEQGAWILDPFVGSGTTTLEARRHGIHSVGVEAHPFVYWVACVKMNWELDLKSVKCVADDVLSRARENWDAVDTSDLPELVHKCYSPENLKRLVAIRDGIRQALTYDAARDFLNLALTDTLRNASKVATGWPYIAPGKLHERSAEKEAFASFQTKLAEMISDLEFMQRNFTNEAAYRLVCGDSRHAHAEIPNRSFDLALTSPPYLNNFDYADRTRLETYFFGWYSTWGEITKQVRSRLMMSATTQVRRD